MVVIARSLGLTYGVSKSLVEEGIFSFVATPWGPNLCLLEGKVEGDLDHLLKDLGEWKNMWFKEVRKWQKSDAKCYRATRVSIFGIPCFVRNKTFIDSLLLDVGMMIKGDSLEPNPERLIVISLMVFTNLLGSISKKIRPSVDGELFNIIISEDPMVYWDKTESRNSGSLYSSEGNGEDEESVSEPEEEWGGNEKGRSGSVKHFTDKEAKTEGER